MSESKQKPLSKRAQDMLVRLHKGEWYAVYGSGNDANRAYIDSPVMRELIDAGLVMTTMRAKVFTKCYVPVGTQPMAMEVIPPLEEGKDNG